MSEIHNLTNKEIKAIKDAISVFKKFGNYIMDVKLTNLCLKRNLDEAIKAGDVTNEQKVNLRVYGATKKGLHNLRENIIETCKAAKPGCQCTDEDQKTCPMWKAVRIAGLLQGVSDGNEFDSEEAFFRLFYQTDRKGYLDLVRNSKTYHIFRENFPFRNP